MAETYTYKGDHADEQGNAYTIGVIDARTTNSTRVGYYYSDGGSLVNLKTAAEEAYTSAGPVHPDNGALRLKGVRVNRMAPNIVRVTLYYSGMIPGINPGKPSAAMVRSDSGYMTFKTWHKSTPHIGSPAIPAFDSFGRPKGDRNFHQKSSGDTYKQDHSRPPQPMYIQVPIQIIRVPALLDADPSNTIVSGESPALKLVEKLGHINADAITWAGVSRPIGSLQFQRFWCEPVVIEDVVKYRAEYTFAYKLSHWVVELPPVWDLTASPPEWVEPAGVDAGTESGAVNPWYAFIAARATFTGAFPLQT